MKHKNTTIGQKNNRTLPPVVFETFTLLKRNVRMILDDFLKEVGQNNIDK